MKIFPIFLLICLSFTSFTTAASFGEHNKVSSQYNPKPSNVEVKKSNINVKENESNHSRSKVDVAKPAIALSEGAKTDMPVEMKPFPWQNLSANITLQQKFNQSILNESIVPFLKECNTFVGKELTSDLYLCPVYFDYLLRLNKILTVSETTALNSSDLITFISKATQNSKFCENIFERNILKKSGYFVYPKEFEKDLLENVIKVCYFKCFKDVKGEVKGKVLMSHCPVIAFMGSEIKKTDSEKIAEEVPEKDEEKIQYPNDKKTSDDDYDSLAKDEEDDEEPNLAVEKEETKPDVEGRKKQAESVPVPESPEIVNSGNFGNPLPIGIEEPDSASIRYFAYATLIVCVVYFGWHYRSKIMGLIVEGRRSQRGRGSARGRKHTAAYRKLDSNLEEAINSSTSSRSNSQIIY